MMLRRPDHSSEKRIFSLTRKFNNILEEVVAGDPHSHILKVQVDDHNANFDRAGNLSAFGRIKYWLNLDAQIRDFDRGKTELQPRKGMYNKYKWSAPRKN